MQQNLCRRYPRLNRLDLFDRPVFVILALDYKRWAAYGIQIALDVPRSEMRVQPDIAPAQERSIHMLMITVQLAREVRRLVCNFRLRDALHGQILDEYVRRFEN